MNNTVENDLFGFPKVRVIQKIKRWTFFGIQFILKTWHGELVLFGGDSVGIIFLHVCGIYGAEIPQRMKMKSFLFSDF